MKWKMTLCFTIICVFLHSFLVADKKQESFEPLWEKYIRNKPHPRVFDNFEYLNMILFSAQKGVKISPRTAAFSDILFLVSLEAIRGHISLRDVENYAQSLVGKPFNTREHKNLRKMEKKIKKDFMSVHPKGIDFRMDVTVGIGFVRQFQRTLENAKSTEQCIKAIERYHGYSCDVFKSQEPNSLFIKEAIDRNIPVLVEQSNNTYKVCFGYLHTHDTLFLFLNDPAKTPIVYSGFKASEKEKESLDPRVIRSLMWDRQHKIKSDMKISCKMHLPDSSFDVTDIKKLTNAKFYVFMNWRKSAEAYKNEICKALGLDPKEIGRQENQPLFKDPNQQLWHRYIHNKTERLSGAYSLAKTRIVPTTEQISPMQACLVSSILSTQGPEVSECAFSLKKVYRAACDLLNNEFLIPTDERKKEMQALADTVQKAYADQQKKAVDKNDKEEKVDDPYIKAALRIRNTIAPTASLTKALNEIERLHGWKAVLETGKDLPLEEYREAVHKRIPIILQDNKTSQWLLAIGYLKHNGKDKLIIADPSLVDEGKSLHIDNQRLYPGACVYFEDFDPKKYTPYFIHNWHISVEHYKDRIAEIFKEEKKPDK